jgi:hypothetical protein
MDETIIRESLQMAVEAKFPDLKVHYIPSGNQRLVYPCIVYEPRKLDAVYSNNEPFVIGRRYQVTLLSERPGFFTVSDMLEMSNPKIVIRHNNTFVEDDIVHDVFTISVNSII